jgi:hypothetical protein
MPFDAIASIAIGRGNAKGKGFYPWTNLQIHARDPEKKLK